MCHLRRDAIIVTGMKKVLLLAVAAVWAAGVRAQFAVDTERRNEPPIGQWSDRQIALVDGASVLSQCADLARAEGGARVEVTVEGSAAGVLRSAQGTAHTATTTAFAVSLIRDNTQHARENTYAAAAEFREAFPGITVEVSYEAPWFRATAGCFVNRTDAVALCGRVLPRFKKAIVIQQELPLAQIIESEKMIPTATATDEAGVSSGVPAVGSEE